MGLFDLIVQIAGLAVNAAQNSSNDKVSNIATKISDSVESAERNYRNQAKSQAKKLSNSQLEYAIDHANNDYAAEVFQEELDRRSKK